LVDDVCGDEERKIQKRRGAGGRSKVGVLQPVLEEVKEEQSLFQAKKKIVPGNGAGNYWEDPVEIQKIFGDGPWTRKAKPQEDPAEIQKVFGDGPWTKRIKPQEVSVEL